MLAARPHPTTLGKFCSGMLMSSCFDEVLVSTNGGEITRSNIEVARPTQSDRRALPGWVSANHVSKKATGGRSVGVGGASTEGASDGRTLGPSGAGALRGGGASVVDFTVSIQHSTVERSSAAMKISLFFVHIFLHSVVVSFFFGLP